MRENISVGLKNTEIKIIDVSKMEIIVHWCKIDWSIGPDVLKNEAPDSPRPNFSRLLNKCLAFQRERFLLDPSDLHQLILQFLFFVENRCFRYFYKLSDA